MTVYVCPYQDENPKEDCEYGFYNTRSRCKWRTPEGLCFNEAAITDASNLGD